MNTLTIRSVPDALKEKLVESARRNRRSLNQEALVVLEDALRNGAGRDVELELSRIRILRGDAAPMSVEEIDAAKREGRA